MCKVVIVLKGHFLKQHYAGLYCFKRIEVFFIGRQVFIMYLNECVIIVITIILNLIIHVHVKETWHSH